MRTCGPSRARAGPSWWSRPGQVALVELLGLLVLPRLPIALRDVVEQRRERSDAVDEDVLLGGLLVLAEVVVHLGPRCVRLCLLERRVLRAQRPGRECEQRGHQRKSVHSPSPRSHVGALQLPGYARAVAIVRRYPPASEIPERARQCASFAYTPARR